MVTHTQNLCSAFNPSKVHTHSSEHTHTHTHTVTHSRACLFQGDFKVTERRVLMKELIDALDDGRILEVFGSGTACVVCPVGSLLYRGQVTRKCTLCISHANVYWQYLASVINICTFIANTVLVISIFQTYQIPTMKNGPDLAKRFHKELTDIQVEMIFKYPLN